MPAPTCTGNVDFTLTITATPSTSDPQFYQIGVNYALSASTGGASPAKMKTFPEATPGAPPPAPQGLTSTVPVGSVACTGGTLKGSAEVSAPLPAGGVSYTDSAGNPVTATKLVQLQITYDVSVQLCGTVAVNTLSTTVPADLAAILKAITGRSFRAGSDMLRHIGSTFENAPAGGWPTKFRAKDS